ncbi:hypothetical protein M703_09305 [Neisseria gonorrhoeae SK29344]|uniref:VacJ n=7 Tax=Neisseria TaxID=482 RepID=Q5F517_NEIG1|nr:hypothetical protein NGO_2122 [Neisseria gonorrhoeae FA 1090]APW54423.1 VacJ [Neisseria gonorrhoeae NG-k51.05]EEH61238.1 conserved hypothetical protein [Neisseria gonorrhoeae 1291]EEZ42732.1 conserved hypothetical protein [Neisseria gonorrhoeae 35/02]EEZ46909.1 hypothetical protein NGFG_00076 [Neisseria gonorrhoeae MS11]EEZ49252.1 conserved hypothetical protein [Neisseria gonorrhoeae PID18]EEZ51483.1 conserved hypothetical protein [Neisseria gonorrhoeae PID1]EEZ53910.1 conserved hypotheti
MPSENPCSDGIPFRRNGQSDTTDWAIIPFLRIPRDSKGKTMYEVNRSVFVLIPLEPFWNWLQTLPGNHLDGLTLEDIQADANSYLVRPCETADEVWDEIEARFEDIFAAELADWCEDEREWPALDADIFNEWFDIQLSTVITDLEHEPLAREAFQPINLN